MDYEFGPFILHPRPRMTMTWDEFMVKTPNNSIALDGIVLGGPRFDERTNHINYDHHDGVIREATFSTSMQVYMDIKGGLMDNFQQDGRPHAHVWFNDDDQDTSYSIWELLNYKLFEGTKSIPHMNRLLDLLNKLDITGGAFPQDLNDELLAKHNWIFEPYTDFRKSGALAVADESALQSNLEAVLSRLDKFLMNQAGQVKLDTRHTMLYDGPVFKLYDEIGGNDARYYLFNHGMNAFISIVARRPDGRMVCTLGKRSRHTRFPIEALYDDYNALEGFTRRDGWNGSNIVGGSSRMHGTGLSIGQLKDVAIERCIKEGLMA